MNGAEAFDMPDARNIARALSAWMLLDMAYVEKQGLMHVPTFDLRGATGRLVSWGVLDFHPSRSALIKGPRFEAVKRAREAIAEAQLRTREMAE